MSNFRFTFILSIVMFVLMGCVGGASPEENIHNVLEETVAKEADYVEVQKPLQDLEEKEKELYNEIMNLGMKEFDKIVKLSDDALENISEREEYIKKEREAMKEAKAQFSSLDDYIGKLDDAKLKSEAEKLDATMKDRYQLHEKLTDSYLKSLTMDKELYELFKKKELTMEELEKQISSINEAYDQTIKLNGDYNTKTDEFNKLKQSFYKTAGIDVEEKS
ncbi:YkyA family protein [Rossellomorea aquimaris]|uniref:YkyA family protein n=1 Tax=Rossellomorea aquimaris TaxID=189382 RepID=UPI001CD218B5|nr:YkyA family protein [Rossellomorea aquimaris]MCA1053347.1 YkyA family protein [Rossellomorea aquimaris]